MRGLPPRLSSADLNIVLLLVAVSGDWLDDIPVLDHLAVFRPVNVNDGFAARIVRQAVPMAVDDLRNPRPRRCA